ncbi:zinc finger BED domain-containing protein RICESLEEPER 2-like [Olea europaea var. sylvestris]|uniref:zinc finger BED domain-containing protein RICESLEEPER 2-like n=1 Tax=Olea europaea var. sylvestris TaxID=158386 RepID=UPI000C1D778D|nr:zinc finger BED domain-containing protein RICESLEEPER 2-like [Olea europaea var. sylvestris]
MSFGKRKLTSTMWEHYKRQKIGEKWKAICNYCKKQLGGEIKNGTKHLHDHLKRRVLRYKDNNHQTTLNFKKDATSGNVTMGAYSLDPYKCRYILSKMVILHEYPLFMVDHIGFREFLHDLQPLFKVFSRNTLKSDILKIYEYERAKNMIALEKIESRISITTDMWTSSNQKRGFMVITAHFIDDAWKLQSRIMRFIYVSCPHTVDVLSETLLSSLMDCNIDRQCCAHILNLIVNDGLDIISGSVEKIRDSIAYWTAMPKRFEKFELFARQLKIDCEKKLRESRYNCFPSDGDWDLEKKYWLESPYLEVQMMATSMMEKFNKYWSDIHGVLALAAVLEPSNNAVSEIDKIYQVCSKLVHDYQKKNFSSGSLTQSSISSCQTETSSANNKSDRMADFYKFVSNVEVPSSVKTELDTFLDEPIWPRSDDFDKLTWWKVNSIKYPTISQIAKDILVIPVFTVASESAFTNSAPSAYFGSCFKMNDEDVDEEDPFSTISEPADE